MAELFTSIGETLLKTAPLAAVLFYFIYKLWEKLGEKDKTISDLNTEIRELERENVEALNRLTTAINELKDFIKFTTGK